MMKSIVDEKLVSFKELEQKILKAEIISSTYGQRGEPCCASVH